MSSASFRVSIVLRTFRVDRTIALRHHQRSRGQVAGALAEGGEGEEEDREEEEADVEEAERVAGEECDLGGGFPVEGDDAEAEHDFPEGSAGVGFGESGVEDVNGAGGPVGKEEQKIARPGDAVRERVMACDEEDHREN